MPSEWRLWNSTQHRRCWPRTERDDLRAGCKRLMTVLLHVCGGVPQGSALVPLLLCQQFASVLTDLLQCGHGTNRNDLCQLFYSVWLWLPGGTSGLQYGPCCRDNVYSYWAGKPSLVHKINFKMLRYKSLPRVLTSTWSDIHNHEEMGVDTHW